MDAMMIFRRARTRESVRERESEREEDFLIFLIIIITKIFEDLIARSDFDWDILLQLVIQILSFRKLIMDESFLPQLKRT